MKKVKLTIVAAATLILGLTSCKKEETTPVKQVPNVIDTTNTIDSISYSEININFAPKYGMASEKDLPFGQDWKHPKGGVNGDTLNFSTFKMYISNIKLKNTDGSYWSENESYHLLDLSNPSSLLVNLSKVPVGNYTEIEFTLGIDSLRNVSGAQTGALATTNNMFWSWNSGYIFVKAEGTYLDNGTRKNFKYHIGGFKGEYNVVTKYPISFGKELKLIKGKNPKINLGLNPGPLWHGSTSVKSINDVHMPGSQSKYMTIGEPNSFFRNPNSFKLFSIEE